MVGRVKVKLSVRLRVRLRVRARQARTDAPKALSAEAQPKLYPYP